KTVIRKALPRPLNRSSGAALESTNKGDKHSGAPGTNLDTAAVENDATAASKSSSAAREGGPEATDAEMTKAGAIAFKRARETPDRTGNVDTSAINEPPTKTATGRRPTFKPRPNLSPDRRGTKRRPRRSGGDVPRLSTLEHTQPLLRREYDT
ncbi:hypothetical protein MRX96_051246, partial [Rhipicephalus microplus]